MCGRPKGATLTTIGLKKRKKGCPIAFRMQHDTKKQEIMLKWVITDTAVVMKALHHSFLINESEIRELDRIQSSILNEDLQLSLIQPFFLQKGWKFLEKTVKMKRRDEIWICSKCNLDIGSKNSILCDSCLLWYHTKCEIKLKSKDKSCDWFCSMCSTK